MFYYYPPILIINQTKYLTNRVIIINNISLINLLFIKYNISPVK